MDYGENFEGVEIIIEKAVVVPSECFLYFPEPHYKLVCSSGSEGVSIISNFKPSGDEISELRIEKVKEIGYGANRISKWDENVFVVTKVGEIESYSVKDSMKIKTILSSSECGHGDFYVTKRIDSDHFLVTVWGRDGRILVVSYTDCTVTRLIPMIPISAYSRIVISKKSPNSFFINRYYPSRDTGKDAISKVDIERGKIIKRYKNHETDQIYAILTYLNPQKDEILVYGNHVVYFINTTTKEKIKEIAFKKVIQRGVAWREALADMTMIGNGYILASSRRTGNLLIIDTLNDYRLKESNINFDSIFCTCLVVRNDEAEMLRNGEIRIVVGGLRSYTSMKVVKVKGLRKGRNILEEEDLKERILFIFQKNIDADKVRIKMNQTNEWTLYKSFLL